MQAIVALVHRIVTTFVLTTFVLALAACPAEPAADASKPASKADGGGEGLEPETDRPGNDFKDFDLEQPDAQLCRKACSDEAQCKAFVYVKPGVQGEKARCWLKDAVPGKVESDCCMAGVKP